MEDIEMPRYKVSLTGWCFKKYDIAKNSIMEE